MPIGRNEDQCGKRQPEQPAGDENSLPPDPIAELSSDEVRQGRVQTIPGPEGLARVRRSLGR